MGEKYLAPKGYKVGELHPTAKDYEKSRQTKSEVPNEREPRSLEGLVQPIGRGRQGLRIGTTSAKAPKICYETKEGDDS